MSFARRASGVSPMVLDSRHFLRGPNSTMSRAQRLLLSNLLLLAAFATVVRADDAAELVSRGMRKFRNNDVAGSLADFDRAARLDPQFAPQLWQRGIADYYVGKFREGRRQFELHQTVNPHDVENAAWHFLCVARLEGVAEARTALLKID